MSVILQASLRGGHARLTIEQSNCVRAKHHKLHATEGHAADHALLIADLLFG
jgi:hypothetical protein